MRENIEEEVCSIAFRITKYSAKTILKEIETFLSESKNKGGIENQIKKASEVKIKDFMKDNATLSNIEVNKEDIKALKNELNKLNVKFSVAKTQETKDYLVFFEAKNTDVMSYAFNTMVHKQARNKEKKESVIEKVNFHKERIKNAMNKDQVKDRKPELSR